MNFTLKVLQLTAKYTLVENAIKSNKRVNIYTAKQNIS